MEKRVLILTSVQGPFTNGFILWGGNQGEVTFDILYFVNFLPKVKCKPIRIMIFYIRYLFALILLLIKNRHYNSIHIHDFNRYYFPLLPIFRLFATKIILTIYGADIYYREAPVSTRIDVHKADYYAEKIFNTANVITFVSQEVLDIFDDYYNSRYHGKLKVVRFGLTPLLFIRKLIEQKNKNDIKKYFNIPLNSIVVVCGAYAAKTQQHQYIIETISRLPDDIVEKCFFMFPLTYGKNAKEVIDLIHEILGARKCNYKILREWLTSDNHAKLRIISDILIHIPTGDTFSGAMMETLYAGNMVITGAWLPYKMLEELGIKLYKIKLLSDLPDLLCYVIRNYNDAALNKYRENNRDLIWQLCSWEQNMKLWLDLY